MSVDTQIKKECGNCDYGTGNALDRICTNVNCKWDGSLIMLQKIDNLENLVMRLISAAKIGK